MKKLSPAEYEICHDAFQKQLGSYSDTSTQHMIGKEIAWQLKRIADYLEYLAGLYD